MPDITGYIITCGAELAREETDAQATDRAKRMAQSHDMVAYIYASKDSGELVPAGHVPPTRGSQEMPRFPEGSGIERGKPRPEPPLPDFYKSGRPKEVYEEDWHG